MVAGFPAVGYAPWSGVFVWRNAKAVSQASVSKGARESNKDILANLRPSAVGQIFSQKTDEDVDKGFCTPRPNLEDLEALLDGQRYRLIRRFAIQQGEKHRVIDDAAVSRQSNSSSDANQLRFHRTPSAGARRR